MDNAKKKAGPAESLSNSEKQANKRRTNVVRRQAEKKLIEHPEDLACMSHMKQAQYW
jgi:hypothetical protein